MADPDTPDKEETSGEDSPRGPPQEDPPHADRQNVDLRVEDRRQDPRPDLQVARLLAHLLGPLLARLLAHLLGPLVDLHLGHHSVLQQMPLSTIKWRICQMIPLHQSP